jgi:HEAT repeat protein
MKPFRVHGFTLIALAVLATAVAFGGQLRSLVGAILQLHGAPVAASSGKLSEHEMEEINAMAPQDQVERLLERAINHYQGAAEEIAKRADGWTGQLHTTPKLETMTSAAYFASDLRVRAVALEIWLAQYGLHKTPEAVDELIRSLASTDRKYFFLSNLGILGNRGVEPEKVFNTILLYVNDPDPAARSGAINALGLLGTENTIAPLLQIFRSDSSYDLRERAACNLADSGLLSRELRKKAVPELLRMSQDPNLDQRMKTWVGQALREINQ